MADALPPPPSLSWGLPHWKRSGDPARGGVRGQEVVVVARVGVPRAHDQHDGQRDEEDRENAAVKGIQMNHSYCLHIQTSRSSRW